MSRPCVLAVAAGSQRRKRCLPVNGNACEVTQSGERSAPLALCWVPPRSSSAGQAFLPMEMRGDPREEVIAGVGAAHAYFPGLGDAQAELVDGETDMSGGDRRELRMATPEQRQQQCVDCVRCKHARLFDVRTQRGRGVRVGQPERLQMNRSARMRSIASKSLLASTSSPMQLDTLWVLSTARDFG